MESLLSAVPGQYGAILIDPPWRFNNRKMNDAERFVLALKGIIGKRLTYTGLTGSELPQTC